MHMIKQIWIQDDGKCYIEFDTTGYIRFDDIVKVSINLTTYYFKVCNLHATCSGYCSARAIKIGKAEVVHSNIQSFVGMCVQRELGQNIKESIHFGYL